jgi:carbon-monoxide dehydrogenase medium subunit
MKMAPFVYHRPQTITEAVDLLAELGGDARVLAGGQSLLPLMALRLAQPEHLIDIGRVADANRIERRSDTLVVGAATRDSTVEHSAEVGSSLPLLSAALALVGHPAIRNRGTVGGSMAHADPAAELPAVAVALGAEVLVRGRQGRRTIAAADFFRSYLTTALEPDELLVEVSFPNLPAGAGWAVEEVSRRQGDFALVGLVATATLDPEGMVATAVLCFFGVGATPVRVGGAERLLAGSMPTPELFEEAAHAVMEELEPHEDIHGSAAYRRHVAGHLTCRCLGRAISRAGGVKPP